MNLSSRIKKRRGQTLNRHSHSDMDRGESVHSTWYIFNHVFNDEKQEGHRDCTPLRHSIQVGADKDTSPALHSQSTWVRLWAHTQQWQHPAFLNCCIVCHLRHESSALLYFCCISTGCGCCCIINGECSGFERIPNEFGDGGGANNIEGCITFTPILGSMLTGIK